MAVRYPRPTLKVVAYAPPWCCGGFAPIALASANPRRSVAAIGTIMATVTLRMPPRELRKPPPRSVPRGIASVPSREVRLDVTARI
jgi:cytochrome P450 family 110